MPSASEQLWQAYGRQVQPRMDREALARDQAQQEFQNNRLLQSDQLQMDQAGRQKMQFEQGQQDRTAAMREQSLNRVNAIAAKALQLQGPQRKQFLMQQIRTYQPDFEVAGFDVADANSIMNEDDMELESDLRARAWMVQEPPTQFERVDGPRGSVLQRDPRTNELKQVVGPDNSQPSAASTNRVRTMTAAEIQAAGLPAGTSAQVDSSGKIDILNKREGLSAAEQKTVREAKMRMPRLNAALRRVDRLGNAVAAIAKNKVFDGGPMDAKALKYTKDGQEVDAAAAQLMPELQALTRVPGIGSQSDLEARLASLAMPSLNVAPEVNARSQAELRAFVEDLKAAYESLLQGGEQAPQAQGAAPSGNVVDWSALK
jgi:hypothetical protein